MHVFPADWERRYHGPRYAIRRIAEADMEEMAQLATAMMVVVFAAVL